MSETKPQRDRVFVSGCYDMLHSGHVEFFREASQYGDLYVGIGSDRTIRELKGRETICSEQERLFMVKAIRYVTDACVNSGSGKMDFIESVERFKPTVFVVNEDGSSETKRQFCEERGIRYVVLNREPAEGLTARSTTDLRKVDSAIPYRLDLAGTWIDQPFVSKYAPGWALTISIEPTIKFIERGGMSTSTRNAIKRMWPKQLPLYNPRRLAKMVFCLENEPNTFNNVSGAQDAIGICMPGLNRHYYNGDYWPEKIESCSDDAILDWLEAHLCMIEMFPRPDGTDVLAGADVTETKVRALAEAADICWEGIMAMDIKMFAEGFRRSFAAQISMFPSMMTPEVERYIDKYAPLSLAHKMAGAGGGGYLALVVEDPDLIPDAIRIKIRRAE